MVESEVFASWRGMVVLSPMVDGVSSSIGRGWRAEDGAVGLVGGVVVVVVSVVAAAGREQRGRATGPS